MSDHNGARSFHITTCLRNVSMSSSIVRNCLLQCARSAWSLGRESTVCSHYRSGGAGSQFLRVPGARRDAYRDTGCLLATSDNAIGKIGPGPSGCGEKQAILHSRPRRWARHSLRARLHLHPTNEDLFVRTPVSGPFFPRNATIPIV